MDFRQGAPDIQYWLLRLSEFGSMRQNPDLLTTLEHTNASACGFFARKGRCGRGFRNLPHTSVLRIRKCVERPSSANQTPVIPFVTCGLTPKLVCARLVAIFPRTSGNGRYGCVVHGKKSAEKRAIKRQPVVLGSVMGIAVAANLYRMRSARHNSPLGIFESRLYSLAAAVSESASQ